MVYFISSFDEMRVFNRRYQLFVELFELLLTQKINRTQIKEFQFRFEPTRLSYYSFFKHNFISHH
jgi:hypothetical protein